MTRREIIKNLNAMGLTKNQANTAVDAFFNGILSALKQQKTVSVVGFGSWEWRQRNPRIARNPKTGEKVNLSSRKALVFKPSQTLKNRLKG